MSVTKAGASQQVFPIIKHSSAATKDDPVFHYPFYPEKQSLLFPNAIHNENYLNFYKDNLEKYQELSRNIHPVFSLNKDSTRFNLRIANFISVQKHDKKTGIFITSNDLLFKGEPNSIYVAFSCDDLKTFYGDLQYFTFLTAEEEKEKFFKVLVEEYDINQGFINDKSSVERFNFLKEIESKRHYDYIFREGQGDKLIHPCLNVLFFNVPEKDDFDSYIHIDLEQLSSKKEPKETSSVSSGKEEEESENSSQIPRDKFTFISKIIPIKKIPLTNNQSVLNLYTYGKIKEISHLLKEESTYKSTVGSKTKFNMCYYDSVVSFCGNMTNLNYGGVIQSNLMLNEISHGTLLFNTLFEPVGIYTNGDYDVDDYLSSVLEFNGPKKKSRNFYIPFNHIALEYLLNCLLEEVDLTNFMKERNYYLELKKKEKAENYLKFEEAKDSKEGKKVLFNVTLSQSKNHAKQSQAKDDQDSKEGESKEDSKEESKADSKEESQEVIEHKKKKPEKSKKRPEPQKSESKPESVSKSTKAKKNSKEEESKIKVNSKREQTMRTRGKKTPQKEDREIDIDEDAIKEEEPKKAEKKSKRPQSKAKVKQKKDLKKTKIKKKSSPKRGLKNKNKNKMSRPKKKTPKKKKVVKKEEPIAQEEEEEEEKNFTNRKRGRGKTEGYLKKIIIKVNNIRTEKGKDKIKGF